MEVERFNRIEELYHQALQLAPDLREEFLEQACGDDAELRREIETLLEFEDSPPDIFDLRPDSLAAKMVAESPARNDLVNRSLSQYKVLKLIGKGGMGEVYLARDTKLDRLVALKILPPQFAGNPDRMGRFVREAKAASALNHPNILTIYEIAESDGVNFIATEFIDGRTLGEYTRNKPFNLASLLDIAIQIASALDEAHSAGIVHRDIKPDNVMVRANGLVKVLDFGIAKLAESGNNLAVARAMGDDAGPASAASAVHVAAQAHRTSAGLIVGTANYMSPEQARRKNVDSRSDIFSFGILLYELLSGQLPFARQNSAETIRAILQEEPRDLGPGIPPEIREIVARCLRKSRSARYQKISETIDDLKSLRRDLEYRDSDLRATSPDRADPVTGSMLVPANVNDRSFTDQTVGGFRGTGFARIAILVLLLTAGGYLGIQYLTARPLPKTIAVIPFVNESGDPNLDFLSDGMTETLINGLSQVPTLTVKARSSVFRYKGKEAEPRSIAAELGVETILTGRINQIDGRIVLKLALIDTGTENLLWGNTYDRPTSALASLQNDIARDVSARIRWRFSASDEPRALPGSTTNPDAYQAFLRGRFYWNRRTAENLRKAVEQFELALAADPNYALAYAGLADCYSVENQYSGTPLTETIPKSRYNAERALAIDSRLAEPHATLAKLNNQLWRWDDAEREFKLAIELNPNYATAYHWYSILLRDMGRYDESAAMIKRAQEIDPLSATIAINVSQVHQARGDHAAAIENTKKLIELEPTHAAAYSNLAISYLKLGRNDEAIASLEKAAQLSDRADTVMRNLGFAYGVAGRRAEAMAIAKELESKFENKKSLAQLVATVYVGLGDKETAFKWLEKALDEKEDLAGIRWTPAFDSLQDDPRFGSILARMGLPR